MRLKNFVPYVKQQVKNYRYIREQKTINKFANFDAETINPEALRQLYPAQKGLAKYAIDKGVFIRISGAEKDGKNIIDKDNLVIQVTNALNGESAKKVVSGNVNDTFEYSYKNFNDPIRRSFMMIHDPQEGTETIYKCKHTYEDNFLRNVYRTICNLTKNV